jgi:uncharacterized protein YbjT (DUF2867 family)
MTTRETPSGPLSRGRDACSRPRLTPACITTCVCVSIVGCERVPIAYFAAKAAQEQVVRGGPVDRSIVRSTQFHELLATSLAQFARWRLLPSPRVALQPVACAEAAATVANVAVSAPLLASIEVAGPAVEDIRAFPRAGRS